jgi:hypothetical protein
MGALHEALCKAILDCGEGVGKDKQAQGYKFRGIDQVLNFLNPIMAKHQLALVPHAFLATDVIERQAKSGTAMYFARAQVEFRLYHASGDYLPVAAWVEAQDTSDKALNKVMSVAWKYAAIQTFCIPVEDVADENTHKEPMEPTPPPPLEFLLGELSGTLVAEASRGTIERYLFAVRQHIKNHPEWPKAEREKWIAHGALCAQALERAPKEPPTTAGAPS